MASKTPDFETSLAQLQQIVESMAQGQLPLDQAIKKFEQGMQLSYQCQQALQQAEQRVSVVMKKFDKIELQPLDVADDLETDDEDE